MNRLNHTLLTAAAVGIVVLAAGEASAQSSWLWYPHASEVTRSRSYSSGHPAIDFAAPCGTAIYAAADGVVTTVVANHSCRVCYDCYSGCGNSYVNGACPNNQIYVDHPNGLQTRYLHIQSAAVSAGQEVRAGQYIGDVGNVGWTCGSTGCHLHFELKSGNTSLDPDAGHWTSPLRYGGTSTPPRDDQPPVCSFPDPPPTGAVLKDGALRVNWTVTDSGGSHLRGTSQSWDTPIDPGSSPQFDSNSQDRHDGYVDLGWAGPGKHTARVRGWDHEGHTCDAALGEFWFYPEPFEREFLLAGPLATEGGGRERLAEEPLGDEATLEPRPGDPAADTVWTAHLDDDDLVDLDAIFGGEERVAYAMTWCYNPGEGREVDLLVGSDDGFRLVVNGERLAEDATPRAVAPDQAVVRARFEAGYNAVLLKIEEKGGGWGFMLRVADPDDRYGLTDIDCIADFAAGPCRVGDRCPRGLVCDGTGCVEPRTIDPGLDAGPGDDGEVGGGPDGVDLPDPVGSDGAGQDSPAGGAPSAGGRVITSSTCAQTTSRPTGPSWLLLLAAGAAWGLRRRRRRHP